MKFYSNELYHYGVKGMKWGVRKEYIPKGRRSGKKESGKNSPERYKKLAKAGFGFAMLSLAAPITYYAITKMHAKALENSRNSKWKTNIKNVIELEELKKIKNYSKDEDMKEVNPNLDPDKIETCMNCTLCTATYDMRRRGYDVTAGFTELGKYDEEITSWYKRAKVETALQGWNSRNFSEIEKQEAVIKRLEALGDGARGHFSAPDTTLSFAHDVAFEIENRKLVFRDCQSNEKYENPKEYLKSWNMDHASFIRTDNLEYADKIINALRRK